MVVGFLILEVLFFFCKQFFIIVGSSIQIFVIVIDALLVIAGLVITFRGVSFGSVVGTVFQEQGQLVIQCAIVLAKIQCFSVIFVYVQGGCGVGVRLVCVQVLYGIQVEESVSGDLFLALGRKIGVVVWGDFDLFILGFQVVLQFMVEDEEDVGFWKGRQDMKLL